jgi:hypothetical protein
MTAVLPARQLDLLRGPRQRGKRPPPPSEFAVHCLVADTLDRWLMPGWVWFHPANGELREALTAGRLKRMGVKPGIPDFVFIAPPNGRLFGFELKRRGQQPGPTQRAMGQRILAAGGYWAWGDSYEKAIAVLKAWGALPDRIEIIDGDVYVRRAEAAP